MELWPVHISASKICMRRHVSSTVQLFPSIIPCNSDYCPLRACAEHWSKRSMGQWTHTFTRCPASVAACSEAKLGPTWWVEAGSRTLRGDATDATAHHSKQRSTKIYRCYLLLRRDTTSLTAHDHVCETYLTPYPTIAYRRVTTKQQPYATEEGTDKRCVETHI